MRIEFKAGVDDHDRRLESVLRRLLPRQPLSTLHKALRKGDIRINGSKSSPDSRVQKGDSIEVWEALVDRAAQQPREGGAKPIPGEWIVFEGSDLVVVTKPSGVLVHRPDSSSAEGDELLLDERVRAWLDKGGPMSLSFRPGPLHRLDRETSGLVVFSRTLIGARSFSQALVEQQVTKTYLAVLSGNLVTATTANQSVVRDESKRRTVLDQRGVSAETTFTPLAHAQGLTLAEVDLGTGRTHQIRVHGQSIGHPLAGDAKYGGGTTPAGLMVPWLLHAWKLSCPLLPPLRAPLAESEQRWLQKTFKFLP